MKTLFEKWYRFLAENDGEDSKIVSKVIILNTNGEFLLLKRKKSSQNHKNIWDLPGGYNKNGEKPEEGAARETEEETSIQISALKAVNKEGKIHFFTTKSYSGTVSDELPEHSIYKWVKFEDLDTYDLPSDAKTAIKTVIEEDLDENYQKYVKVTHPRHKKRLIATGEKKNEPPYTKNPSLKRTKSSPVGFQGA